MQLDEVGRATGSLGAGDEDLDQVGRRLDQAAHDPPAQAEAAEGDQGDDPHHPPFAPGELHIGDQRAKLLQEHRDPDREQPVPHERGHPFEDPLRMSQRLVA